MCAHTLTLTTSQDVQTANVFNGVINFGGGTQASTGTTMNSFDQLTGDATRSNNTLNVQLTNANGQAIGSEGGAAVAQVNKYTLPTVTANQQQSNQYVFPDAATATAGSQQFTYGGAAGSFVTSTTEQTTAANFINAVNALAGSTVAVIGGTDTLSAAITATTATSIKVATSGIPANLKVGMSLTYSSSASGLYITGLSDDGTDTTITLNKAVGATASSGATITFGGGDAGVTVYAPTAGVVSPSISFTTTAGDVPLPASSLVVPNITGNVGATVNFTYGTQQGSYVIGSSIDATAVNLAAALNAVAGSAATAAVVNNGSNDYVTLTAAVPGIALPAVTFTGTVGNLPTATIATPNATASGISLGTNTGLNIVNLSNVSGSAVTVSGSAAPGATAFRSNLSTNNLSFTDLTQGTTAFLRGNASLANGGLTASYTSSATSGAVVLENGTTGGAITISGSGLTSQTISSLGAANTVGAVAGAGSATSTTINATTNLTTGALTNAGSTLTVTGVGAVNLSSTALQSSVKTVNASANSGGLTVTLNGNTDISVTGGSGNDAITAGAALDTGFVNGGSGTDKLLVGTNVSYINTAAKAAKYTNFEILSFSGALSLAGFPSITALEISGNNSNNVTDLSAVQAGAITATANIGSSTFALANSTGTSDTLSLTMGSGGTGTNAATTAGTLTINGFETLNLRANPGSTATAGANRISTIDAFTADKLTRINLTGTSVKLSNAATTLAVAIDASALTGEGSSTPVGLDIAGDLAAGSTVNGSNLQDKIALGAVGSTYNAGGGDDLFSGSVGKLLTGSTYNTINGGGGTNTLTIDNGSNTAVTMIDNTFKNISSIQKIVISNSGTGAQTVTTGGFFNTNFASGVNWTSTVGAAATTYDFGTYSGNATITLTTGATSDNTSVTTGSGNDTVNVTAASVAAGDVILTSGGGNDILKITASSNLASGAVVKFVAGTGKDLMTIAGVTGADNQYVTFEFATGDSTASNFDEITGYVAADGTNTGMLLDFAGSATVASNVTSGAVTGYTSSELTYSIATGKLTFSGTSASSLTNAQIASIAAQITPDTKTLGWVSVDGLGSYIFNDNASGNSLVYLDGLTTLAGLSTSSTTADTVIIG